MSQLVMTCPSGGSFYACDSGTRFVGCCASNPCGSSGCPAGNLKPASFPASQYGSMPDQQCEAGLFYTCSATSPPFWGCCKTNPCNAGSCSANSLSGAFLSNNPGSAAPYLALNGNSNAGTSSITPTSTAPTSTAPTSTAPTSTAPTSTAPTSTAPSSSIPASGANSNANITSTPSSNAGAIAGGVVGGLAVLAILILGITFLLRRRKQHASHERDKLVPGVAALQQAHPYKDESPNLGKYSPQPNEFSPWSPYGAKAATPPPTYGFTQFSQQIPRPQEENAVYELPVREIAREYSELPGDTRRRPAIE